MRNCKNIIFGSHEGFVDLCRLIDDDTVDLLLHDMGGVCLGEGEGGLWLAGNLVFVELLHDLLVLRLLVLLGLHHLVVICILLRHFFILLLLCTLARLIQLLLPTVRSLEDFINLFHALILEVTLDLEYNGLAIRDRLPKFIAGAF